MNTDAKWFVILIIAFIAVPIAGFGLRDYQKGQCRIEAIKVGMDADKIGQVCK
jgi:hypothetical protein